MKISDRFRSIEQVEVESKVEQYKGPKSLKQDDGFDIPQEVVDRFEDQRQRAVNSMVSLGC